jgi:hypothetical protein
MIRVPVLALAAVVIATALASPASAQHSRSMPVRVDAMPVNLSGPRFGITFLPPALSDSIGSRMNRKIQPVISQFGWQVETRLFTADTGLTVLTEMVGLVGGLEQGIALPSGSWLVGLRGSGGTEVAVGPNISAAGAGLAIAGGIDNHSGDVNFPVNMAVVMGRGGMRLSLLVGFTWEH